MKKFGLISFVFCLISVSVQAENIDFNAAVQETLKMNTTILNAQKDMLIAEAQVEKTYGMFDFKLDGSVTVSNSKVEDTTGLGLSPDETSVFLYKLALSEKTLLGGIVNLELNSNSMEQLYRAGMFYPDGNELITNQPKLSLTYTQPLLKDFWGRPDRLALQIADASITLAKEGVLSAVQTQIAILKEAYLTIYQAQRILKVQQESLVDTEKFYDQTKRMQKIGLREQKDLYQTKISSLNAKAGILLAQDNVKQAKERFFNLAGYAESVWLSLDIEPETILEEFSILSQLTDVMETELVEKQSSVKRSKLRIEISELNKKITKNATLPSLSLFGSYGIEGNETDSGSGYSEMVSNKYNNYAVGINFTMYLQNRTSVGDLKEIVEKLNKDKEDLEALRKTIRLQIRYAYKALISSQQDYALYKEARVLAEKSLVIHNSHFNQGRITTRELLAAQSENYGTQLNEINALVSYMKAVNQWKKLTGAYDNYYTTLVKESDNGIH